MTLKSTLRIGTSIFAAILLTAPLAAHESDAKVEQSFELSGFSKINIDGVYLVTLTQGPEFSIQTSGDEKEMDDMTVKLEGDTLILGSKKNMWSRNNDDRHGITTVITMPSLEAIKINGVTEFKGKGLDLGDLDLDVNGVADMTLSGTCNDVTAKINGVGDIDLKALKCSTGDLSVNGAGELSAYTSKSVKARINGVGEMNIYGDPNDVDKKKTWLGSINIK